jgi:hypothetical protein
VAGGEFLEGGAEGVEGGVMSIMNTLDFHRGYSKISTSTNNYNPRLLKTELILAHY